MSVHHSTVEHKVSININEVQISKLCSNDAEELFVCDKLTHDAFTVLGEKHFPTNLIS